MKKIEKRSFVCLLLAAALILGTVVFAFRFFLFGGSWVSFAANRHIYNSQGTLSVGTVLDRDGTVLSWADEDGNRHYSDSKTVRKATLHAVGDPNGNIGTGALTAFAAQMSGYNVLTGVSHPFGTENEISLTISAAANCAAYEALNGRKGTVGVYNYKTGEILCMVSNPTFDPADPPEITDGDERYEGVYLNRLLSGTFPPGSIFKTVTLAAAIENIPDLFEREWTCTGECTVGEGTVTCPQAHGTMGIYDAFANSCNCVFAQLAVELGSGTLQKYAEKAGLTDSYAVSGLSTSVSRFDFASATENQLGWAGVGQDDDLVNPCAFMVYMGAIANGGKAAVPELLMDNGLFSGSKKTSRLVSQDTAETLTDMLSYNVTAKYGASRFPNMDVCAKSGTAEVGGGEQPHAWFAGFLRDEEHPYAFIVLVENGGSGANVAGSIAAQVLDTLVNGS